MHIYIYVNVYMYICIHVNMCIYIHTCIYVHLHICIYVNMLIICFLFVICIQKTFIKQMYGYFDLYHIYIYITNMFLHSMHIYNVYIYIYAHARMFVASSFPSAGRNAR